MPSPPRRWLIPAAALVCLLLLGLTLAAAIQTRGMEVCDDAFISFRVAHNVARGNGVVFNPPGPPVEAASNFLLVLGLAGAELIGVHPIHASLALGVGCGALALVLLCLLVGRSVGPWGLWAPLALACMTIFHRNLVHGLETGPLTLLLLAAVAVYLRARRGPPQLLALSSLLLVLVSLTRPEGPMYMVGLGVLRLWDLLASWRRRDLQRGWWRREAWWAGGFLLPYLPYLAWRVTYFEQWFPNAYYAKEMFFSGPLRKLQTGAIYLEVVTLMEPLLLLSVAAGVWLVLAAPTRRARVLLALVVTQCLFMVLSGGDWSHMFGFGRFLCPVLPLSLWLLAEAGVELARRISRRAVVAGLAVLLAVLTQLDLLRYSGITLPPHFQLFLTYPARLTRQAVVQAYLKNLPSRPWHIWRWQASSTFYLARYAHTFDADAGRWLLHRYGRTTRIASIQAGQFAYWSELPMFDMFGLATPRVATFRDDPLKLASHLLKFNPQLVTFYRWGDDVHHKPLVLEGTLWREGFGLRYVLLRPNFRAFLIFERGFPPCANAKKAIFAPLDQLPKVVPPRCLVELKDAK